MQFYAIFCNKLLANLLTEFLLETVTCCVHVHRSTKNRNILVMLNGNDSYSDFSTITLWTFQNILSKLCSARIQRIRYFGHPFVFPTEEGRHEILSLSIGICSGMVPSTEKNALWKNKTHRRRQAQHNLAVRYFEVRRPFDVLGIFYPNGILIEKNVMYMFAEIHHWIVLCTWQIQKVRQ